MSSTQPNQPISGVDGKFALIAPVTQPGNVKILQYSGDWDWSLMVKMQLADGTIKTRDCAGENQFQDSGRVLQRLQPDPSGNAQHDGHQHQFRANYGNIPGAEGSAGVGALYFLSR